MGAIYARLPKKTEALKTALFAICIVLVAATTALAGDIDSPTSASDCYRQPLKFISTKRLSNQFSACFDNAVRKGGSALSNNSPTTCMGNWVTMCVHFRQKQCDIEAKYDRRLAQCLIKMRKLALDQENIKAQQDQFQKEQREAEQRRQNTESKRRSDMYTQLNQVQKYKDSAIVGGHLAGRLGGATQPPISGSYYLSQAISQAGTRFITGTTAEALLQLEAALYEQPARAGIRFVYPDDGYSATNPRPTLSRQSSAFALYESLRAQANRTSLTSYRLPLPSGSAVSGSFSGILTQIVKSQLSGQYPDLGSAIAGYVSTGSSQAIDYENDNKSFVTNGTLKERRREVFARIEEERIRVEKAAAEKRASEAAEARRIAEANAAASRARSTKKSASGSTSQSSNSSVNNCIKGTFYEVDQVEFDNYRARVTNTCGFRVSCDLNVPGKFGRGLDMNAYEAREGTYDKWVSMSCRRR